MESVADQQSKGFNMRIAVTGGSGKVGRAAVAALRGAGHRTVNFDVRPSPDGGRQATVDCADFGQVMGGLSGVDALGGVPDAVVHLAGIPAPGLAPDHRIFEVNTLSTYNVFSACARLGIKRVVWASSETILGLPFTTPPDFAPLDESHPDRPEWSYALAKQLGEAQARAFVRWNPDMAITSLRFSNVYAEDDYRMLSDIQARPEQRKFNLWGYVDARDAGEACRLAVEHAQPRHEVMIIAADDTIMDRPSAALMAEHFPGVPVKGGLGAFQSLLSSAKAARLIGFRARHSWRDQTL
jgi:nucleoside-diphosphate-sugar epimerase